MTENTIYNLIIICGFCTLSMAYLPILSEKIRISYTVFLLFLGVVVSFIYGSLEWPSILENVTAVKGYTELIVVISLMTAGIKIGLKYSLKDWLQPLRLILLTMPLFMLCLGSLFYFWLELPISSSILLAAVLAPTDPVLASELQLNTKQKAATKNKGIRFILTAEAGINDGLAFPFVMLAILLSTAPQDLSTALLHWLSFDVFYKIGCGILVGVVIGYIYSWTVHNFSASNKNKIHNGFVAISLTAISFVACELVSGYGFLSVFFTGLLSHYHYHKEKEQPKTSILPFIEEFEKLLTVLWLLYFGGTILEGVLAANNVISYSIAFLSIFMIRPLIGYVNLQGLPLPKKKKWAVAFFGMRGVGSMFYLVYAFEKGAFQNESFLLSIVALVMFISILVHGCSSPSVIAYFKNDPS